VSVQTYIPRRAFDALDMPLIIKLARLAGIDRPRIESSTHKIPGNQPAGSVRITCSLEMALALVEAFRQQATRAEERGEPELLVASAHAVGKLFAAIDEARTPPPGSPRFGTNS
jgi:hypothetical protein